MSLEEQVWDTEGRLLLCEDDIRVTYVSQGASKRLTAMEVRTETWSSLSWGLSRNLSLVCISGLPTYKRMCIYYLWIPCLWYKKCLCFLFPKYVTHFPPQVLVLATASSRNGHFSVALSLNVLPQRHCPWPPILRSCRTLSMQKLCADLHMSIFPSVLCP